MTPKMWEKIIIKWRKSHIGGGSKLAGKKGQFSAEIFIGVFTQSDVALPQNFKYASVLSGSGKFRVQLKQELPIQG